MKKVLKPRALTMFADFLQMSLISDRSIIRLSIYLFIFAYFW